MLGGAGLRGMHVEGWVGVGFWFGWVRETDSRPVPVGVAEQWHGSMSTDEEAHCAALRMTFCQALVCAYVELIDTGKIQIQVKASARRSMPAQGSGELLVLLVRLGLMLVIFGATLD